MIVGAGSSETRAHTFWTATAACLIWNGPWWLQPQLVSFAITRFGVGVGQAGILASVEIGMIAATSMLLARFLDRFSAFQFLLVAMALTMAGDVVSLLSPAFSGLLACRFVAGIGEGMCLIVSNALVADYAEPDRAYAQMNVINILVGSLLITSLPMLPAIAGEAPVLVVLLGLLVVCTPVMLHAPRTPRRQVQVRSTEGPSSGRVVPFVLLALSVFVLTLGGGGLYALEVELGRQTGLSEDNVNTVLSGAVLFSLLGSGIVVLIATRFGRVLPTIVGLAVHAACCFALTRTGSPVGFAVVSTILMITAYYLQPFYLGQAASWDPAGKLPALLGSVYLAGAAVTPVYSGYLAEQAGYAVVGDAAVVLVVAAASLFALAGTLSRRPARQACATS